MHATPLPLIPLLLLVIAPLAQAQEMARVISSTPINQQVSVPRQVCTDAQVITQAPKTGAGAVVGAIVGGALGSQIGGGSGQVAATALGVIGGAMIGDEFESNRAPVSQPVTSCAQQVSYENRVVGYNVVYEYAGKQYSTQMASDPGAWIPLNIAPAGAATVQAATTVVTPPPPPPVVVPAPVQVTTYPPLYPPPVYGPPVYGAPVYAPPVYGAPVYSPRSYGAPIYNPPVIQFRWSSGRHWHGDHGFHGGHGGHGRHHRHGH